MAVKGEDPLGSVESRMPAVTAQPHSYTPLSPHQPSTHPEEVGFSQGLDELTTEEGNYLYGKDETSTIVHEDQWFWFKNILSDALERLKPKIDRQGFVGLPSLGPIETLAQTVLFVTVISAMVWFTLPSPQLHNHPRCGITGGGQV